MAYLRELDDETILCVVNVSNAPQAVELDLAEFNGTGLTELTAGTPFPRVGELPYLLTLAAYGFYWFRIEKTTVETSLSSSFLPELFTSSRPGGSSRSSRGVSSRPSSRPPRRATCRRAAWFAAKGSRIAKVTVEDFAVLREGRADANVLPILSVPVGRDQYQSYFTPLAADYEAEEDDALLPFAVARLRRGARMGLLYDADAAPGFALAMLNALKRGDVLSTNDGGQIRFTPSPLLASEQPIDVDHIRRMGAEQSNSSINLDIAWR